MQQDTEQISGKQIHAQSGCAFENGQLVPVVLPEPPLETVGLIFESLIEFGVALPADEKIKLELVRTIEAILDETGDQHRKETLGATLKLFLSTMTDDATPLQVGQRVIVLAYLLGNEVKTKVELARNLKVSPARVSQILLELPSELRAMCNYKSRTAKAGAIDGD